MKNNFIFLEEFWFLAASFFKEIVIYIPNVFLISLLKLLKLFKCYLSISNQGYPVNICIIEFNYLMKRRGRVTESEAPNLKLTYGGSVDIYN